MTAAPGQTKQPGREEEEEKQGGGYGSRWMGKIFESGKYNDGPALAPWNSHRDHVSVDTCTQVPTQVHTRFQGT